MNTRNLRKRRQGWAAVVYVPEELQELAAKRFGRKAKRLKEIVKGLGTRDLAEANKRKLAVIAQIQTELASLQNIDLASVAFTAAHEPSRSEAEEEAAGYALTEMAKDIEAKSSYEVAKRFYNIAANRALPMSTALEQWKTAADGIKKTTLYLYTREVQAFIDWSGDVTVQEVDDIMAQAWWNHLRSTPTRNKTKIAPNTLKRKVGSLARLWKWMKARHVFKGPNHWEDLLQDVPGEAKRGTNVKDLRAFTREEVKIYLKAIDSRHSRHTQARRDVVTLVWHTGIRPNDICSLTTDRVHWDNDEKAYWITVLGKTEENGGKTKANARVMPVISAESVAILKRRVDGADDGILFHEVEPEKHSGKRYDRLQRKMNEIRREALPGVPVDTYSLRRAFSAACEDAGLDPVQWSRMMGHSAPTLAAAVYNRGHEGRKKMLDGIRLVEKELGELTGEINGT